MRQLFGHFSYNVHPWYLELYLAEESFVRIFISITLSQHIYKIISFGLRNSKKPSKKILGFAKNNLSAAICNNRYIYTEYVQIEARASISFKRFLIQPLFKPGLYMDINGNYTTYIITHKSYKYQKLKTIQGHLQHPKITKIVPTVSWYG